MNQLSACFNACSRPASTVISICIAMVLAAPATALKYSTADESFDIRLKGRLQYDYNDYSDVFNADDNGNSESRWFVRRSRLALQGQWLQDWEYKVQWNLGVDSRRNASKGGTSEDVYLRYKGIENLAITVGQQKDLFGLEELTSSNNITAIERAAATQVFAPGRSIGVNVATQISNFTWAVYYADEGSDGEDALSRAYSTRITFSPVHDDGNVVHFGASYLDRRRDENSVKVRPELRDVDSNARIRSGNFDSDTFNAAGAEFAWIKSRVHLQAEYFAGTYEGRDQALDYDIDGWYVKAGFFLTDDARRYSFSKGVFSSIKPQSAFGAVEVFARYGEVDLQDNGAGNAGQITTVGLNWYINKHFRTGINAINAKYDNPVNAEDSGNAIAARIQFTF